MKTYLLFWIIFVLFCCPVWCEDSKPSSATSEVEIVSAEFGRFPDGKGPRQQPGKEVVFEKTNKVGASGYTYGWKIALNTTKKTVTVSEKWDGNDKLVSSTAAALCLMLAPHLVSLMALSSAASIILCPNLATYARCTCTEGFARLYW